MSLKALPIPPIPEEVACVAHAVFPHGTVFMQVRDTLGALYTDEGKARPISHPWSTRFCPPFAWPWSPCSNLWST
jgi:hypothetical protein